MSSIYIVGNELDQYLKNPLFIRYDSVGGKETSSKGYALKGAVMKRDGKGGIHKVFWRKHPPKA